MATPALPASPNSPVPATSPTTVIAGHQGFVNASLYVGDLDASVTEAQLFELFSQVSPVVSVRVCRDQIRRVSLGYGYVNYGNPQDARRALDMLNFTSINGRPLRIMFSHRDPSIRKSGYANIFIKNLDTSIDNKALYDTFASFGTILSCKIATDGNGRSKGYGFVQFEREEAAQNAIARLNGMLINDKQVYVGLFVRRQERVQTNGSIKFSNVYVKNLATTVKDEDLKTIFGNYGPITSVVIMRDSDGNSRGFGFVNFQNPDDAATAVEKLNGYTLDDGKIWYVGRAQRKAEREAELKAKFEQERNGRLEKLQGTNLYLKNLDESIDDEKLKEIFSEFGTTTSCKVMCDSQGQSKGSGFVAFSTVEEASRAIAEMNGKMIGKKPLYVAVAQRKEERRTKLQAHFAQLHSFAGVSPSMVSNLPGFHPGAARLGPPQLFYGQGAPGMVSPQPAGYGFQQQMLQGMRPGVTQMPNFVMPYHLQRQGQLPQSMGTRRGGRPQIQHQQINQRNANQGFRYRQTPRRGLEPQMLPPQGVIGPMVPMPLDASGMPIPSMDAAPRPQPIPITALASALASATPEQQRVMLGEQLFPLVERVEHDHAGKVTGMLLEMDQTEVLHLIESPEALKAKIAEALEVLQMAQVAAAGSDAAEQLGSLSLAD